MAASGDEVAMATKLKAASPDSRYRSGRLARVRDEVDRAGVPASTLRAKLAAFKPGAWRLKLGAIRKEDVG